MKTKIFSAVMALALIFSACKKDVVDSEDSGEGTRANNKVENVYKEGAEIKQDFNNAQFHCNAISGNGRVWPEYPADMKKFEGQLTFTKAEGTRWNLTDVKAAKLDAKGKVIAGQYEDLDMVVCPVCGSTNWITFSNNSGVPDGKNVQMQHPGADFSIIKLWEKNNEPYAIGTKFFANFEVTLSSGKTYKVGPGKYFLPEDLTATVEEKDCTSGFELVSVLLNGDDQPVAPVSGIVGGDAVTFVNKDDEPDDPCETIDVWFHPANNSIWDKYFPSSGSGAIIKLPYNSCDDGCFDTWVKKIKPEDLWGHVPGFEEFLCTFEGWLMSYTLSPDVKVETDGYCEPIIVNNSVKIWAKHGENKCKGSIAPSVVLLETYKIEVHNPIYKVEAGSYKGTMVAKSSTTFTNNGHTYVAAANGTYEIANSSPSNAGIGLFFSIEKRDDGYYIVLDEKLVSANVGAVGFDVVPSQSDFRAPGHTAVSREYGPIRTFVSSGNQGNAPVYTGDGFIQVHFSRIEWSYVTDEIIGCELVSAQEFTRGLTRTDAVISYVVSGAAGDDLGLTDLLLGDYTVELKVDGVSFGAKSVTLAVPGAEVPVNFGSIVIDDLGCTVTCEYVDCPGCLCED